jgi:peptidoglycan/LPS O-acetylase OafA/YrhL
VHLSVIDRHVGPELPRGAHIAVSLVLAVALAAALHHAVERPFQRWLSGRPPEPAPAI